jgi:hypothetical protein
MFKALSCIPTFILEIYVFFFYYGDIVFSLRHFTCILFHSDINLTRIFFKKLETMWLFVAYCFSCKILKILFKYIMRKTNLVLHFPLACNHVTSIHLIMVCLFRYLSGLGYNGHIFHKYFKYSRKTIEIYHLDFLIKYFLSNLV